MQIALLPLPHSLRLLMSRMQNINMKCFINEKNEIKKKKLGLLHYFSLKWRTCAVCTRRFDIMMLSCWRYFPLNIAFLCTCVCVLIFRTVVISNFLFALWLNVFLCCCCCCLVRSVSRLLCSFASSVFWFSHSLSLSLSLCVSAHGAMKCVQWARLCAIFRTYLSLVYVHRMCHTLE